MDTITLSKHQYQTLLDKLDHIEHLLKQSFPNETPEDTSSTDSWTQQVREAYQEYQAKPNTGNTIDNSQELQSFLDELKIKK